MTALSQPTIIAEFEEPAMPDPTSIAASLVANAQTKMYFALGPAAHRNALRPRFPRRHLQAARLAGRIDGRGLDEAGAATSKITKGGARNCASARRWRLEFRRPRNCVAAFAHAATPPTRSPLSKDGLPLQVTAPARTGMAHT
jgi:hypothetical protein